MAVKKSISPRDSLFVRVVEGYIKTSGLTKEQICSNLGITTQTLRNYMSCPDMFRRGELRRLCDMIHVSDEDRGKLV